MKLEITIPEFKLESLNMVIEKLNKKARKLGVSEIRCNIVNTFSKKVMESNLNPFLPPFRYVPYFNIEIEYISEIVLQGGWKILAHLEDYGDGTIISRLSGSDEQLKKYRGVSLTRCDHCKQARRRKVGYVLQDEKGTETLVGSTCVKDFIGSNVELELNKAVFCARIYNEFSDPEDDLTGNNGNYPRYYDVIAIAKVITMALRENGYSYYAESKDLVKARIFDILNPPKNTFELVKWKANAPKPQESDTVYQTKIKERFNQIQRSNPDDLGEFDYKIRTVSKSGYVEDRHLNLIIGFCVGCILQARKEEKRQENASSEFFGTVKKRQEFYLELTDWKACEGYYGTSYILKGKLTGTNNNFVWFSSKPLTDYIDPSTDEVTKEPVRVKATVKAHKDDYRFGKQTVLTRVQKL
jgi:hypothetical protein